MTEVAPGRTGSANSALRRLAQQAAQATAATMERCEFCGEPIPTEHRHLMEVETRDMKCVCRACSILFDSRAASVGRYVLVPERRLYFESFAMRDTTWERLRIPVGIAFLFYSSPAARMVAYYPSPMGPTESLLEQIAWEELVAENPTLGTLVPDVEALLVNRARGARDYYLVPMDECYRLVGIVRTSWRGLTGGQEVWQDIRQFFAELRARSKGAS